MNTSYISTEKWFSFYACVSSLGMTMIETVLIPQSTVKMVAWHKL